MTPDLLMGIDPGKSGGIALLTLQGEFVEAFPMPETERDTAEIFTEFGPRISVCAIERLQPMFKTSKVAMFKLGQSYGFLRGLLIVLQIRFEEIRPQVWQKGLACLSGGKKAVTRARAQQLWPKQKITNKTADSLLIAEYLRRTLK